MARLERLLEHVEVFERPPGAVRMEISGVTEHVDEVRPGWLFACVVGDTHDGHAFASAAIDNGASVLIVDRDMPAEITSRASIVRVYDVRSSLGRIAAAFYSYPAQHMHMVGVTGTNGKTTTVHLLLSIFRANQWKAETIGTLSGHYTTPPPVKLQSMLSDYWEERLDAVAMEVSSAGLAQHRVDPIQYDVAIFTNLTQDHLDYHGTMERYFEAKSMLFDPLRSRYAVINSDDPYGRRLLERIEFPVTAFGIDDAENLKLDTSGSSFDWNGARIELPLVGGFNVSNALGAANAARALGIAVPVIAQGLSNAPQVPGRFEMIDCGQPFGVVVDFAHTPDGLGNALSVARSVVKPNNGRVIVVFGAGGDRDPDKRPKMGAIAASLADIAIVTNDNPRGEDPDRIARDIVADRATTIELDRTVAIERAIASANNGDIIVIAGKGHEATQEIDGVKYPFSDQEVARRVLAGIAS